MSKVVILGDLHIGARNANMIVANHQLTFFEKELFPYMLTNGIDTILQTGDLFDTRKFSNHVVLAEWHTRFFQMLRYHGFKLHTILGNHDLAFKNTVRVNSPSLFLAQYDNVKVYDTIDEFEIDGFKMLMVPWICSENKDDIMAELKNTKCSWVLGHFEIKDFEMHAGQMCVDGMDKSIFERFDNVLSGHFHTRSKGGHITYLGTPYEMTWIDHGDPKGFHVLDTSTLSLDFIQTKLNLFNKIFYNDKNIGLDYHKGFDLTGLENTYVKVIVVNKTNTYEFDSLMDRLYALNLLDLKVVEDLSDLEASNIDDDCLEMEDTKTLIESYVDSVETTLDVSKLKSMMKSLYVEAMNEL